MSNLERNRAPVGKQALVHTDKGTPAGELLRRYWQPVALLQDLEQMAGAPLALRIMGEDLVLFRDEAGRLGLVARRCAHRCADLSYGRVENGGLRCLYHGWLFDVEGQCLERPGQAASQQVLASVRQPAYPCREAAGACWAYLGPGEPPPFPNYPALQGPASHRFVWKWLANCNYLQANEGNLDPVHTSFLHRHELPLADGARQKSMAVFATDAVPELSVEEQRYGLRIMTERQLPGGTKTLRVSNFVMPNACAIPGPESGLGRGGCSMFWHVPIDDHQHLRFEFTFHSKQPVPRQEWQHQIAAELDAASQLKRSPANRWLQDRESMRSGSSFAGLGPLFVMHDLFVTESQGVIHERANEHLSSTDIGIARARRQMIDAIHTLQAGGRPPGLLAGGEPNAFADLVVVSETLGADEDPRSFCARLAAEDIYQLVPAR